MVDYGKVRSTVKPEKIVIDDFSVWQHTDIQEISENVGKEGDQAAENAVLSQQITDTQIALCEVYEMMV